MSWRVLVLLPVGACTHTAEPAGAPPPPWQAPPPLELDLRARLSADEVPLLGELRLWLDLYRARGVSAELRADVPPGFRGTVVPGEPTPLGDGSVQRFELRLQPVRLGDLKIPPLRIEGKRVAAGDPLVATTDELSVRVGSVLGEHGADVEAPAPPFAVPADPLPWILGAGALALLAAGGWWWRRRRQVKRPAAAETPLPPHVTALRALSRLRGAPRSTPAEVDAFYVEVSAVLRRYLEDRFGMHAPERTTEEFLAELEADRAATPLDGRQRNVLGNFLRQCDLVKFARWLPAEADHDRTLHIAEQFVETTRSDRIGGGTTPAAPVAEVGA